MQGYLVHVLVSCSCLLLVLRALSATPRPSSFRASLSHNGPFAVQKKVQFRKKKTVTVAQHLVLLYKNKVPDNVENPH